MKYIFIILFTLIISIGKSQNIDKDSLIIKSYFEHNDTSISSYFTDETILDIKGDTYFTTFDEFDLFIKYVVMSNDILDWSYSRNENNYTIIATCDKKLIIFNFEISNNKFDYIYITKHIIKKR
jgi:hypothetical protein